jgi:2-keto-4-pentenoate hydratase
VLRRWLDRGERLGGWKIAFTSRGLRGAMGEEYRPFGYVLAGRIQTGGTLAHREVPGCALEPELCVTIGERLGGVDVTPERARSAVRSVSAAFEINSKRLPRGSSEAVRIGNAMNNWGIVLGPEHAPDEVALDAVPVKVFKDGVPIAAGDSGPATLDDPYLSLARVCRVLAAHDLCLEPGQRVITGSLTPGLPTGDASEFHAEFGGLGSVAVGLR